MHKPLTSLLTLCAALVLALPAPASAADAAACEKQAVDKNGKALAGAARTSFMKKCTDGAAAGSSCEAKAVPQERSPRSAHG